ncbi:glycosyltransferase [Gemmatimonadota bacterium]
MTYHGGAGGVSVLISDLVKILSKSEGIEIDVCYASHKGIVGEKVEKIANRTYCLGMKNGFDLVRGWKLKRIIKGHSYDIVHLHYFTPLLRCLVYFSHPGVIIQTEHGGIKGEMGHKRWPMMRFIHRLLRKTATIYTAVSNDSKEDLVSNRIADESNVRVIYNGIFADEFKKSKQDGAELRRTIGFAEDDIIVGTVRTLTPKMGIDHLLHAARKILYERNNIKFMIIGDGNLRNELEVLSKNLDISPNVIFLGERTDIGRCLSLMDVFVMPSVWETFGIAAAEAMAAEVPVVAYAVGGLRELIEDKVSGLLIEKRDPNLLAEGILSLVDNRNAMRRISREGVCRVRSCFDIRETAQKYLELYSELLSR